MSLLLEQIVKCLTYVVTIDGLSAAPRGQGDAVVRLVKIAEIGLHLISH